MTVPIDHHATCHHKTYKLTCDEFDALLVRAGHACELCGQAGVSLWIDHDHDEDGRVRGLLCAKCNSHMRWVDSGAREPSEHVVAYKAKAVQGTRALHMLTRVFRVQDELWLQAVEIAKQRGESLSEVLRDALRRYVRRHQ